LGISAIPAFSQEVEERIVDEVVAQVNDGVITLSRVNREAKGIVDSAVQNGTSRDEAQKRVDEQRGALIARMINEELIVQKAKEMGLDADIEAAINQRLLQIMTENNLKTLESLYEKMRAENLDPDEIRETMRKQITGELVLQREVSSKIYWSSTGKELKDYFEKNKSKFVKPETVTLSEIFLSFAGREEAVVREKAKQLVAQLRGGADFQKLVAENSDRRESASEKGKVGTASVKDLDPKFGTAIANVKVGGYSDPVEDSNVGVIILRVDERTAAGSESVFDEDQVRRAILADRAPEEQKKFMVKLREDAVIKINPTYRPIVSPVLFAEERRDKPAN
jgi:hypothetical protein